MKKAIVILALLAIVIMIAWKVSAPFRQKTARQSAVLQTSDAGKVDRYVRVAGDDWLGYLFFRSKFIQRELQPHRLGVKFEMVPDFKERFEGLETGKYDIVVATIDSYLLNAIDADYPGVIAFIIDESYGGDAIIAGPKIKSIDDLDRKGIQGAFVGFSPSEFLLKSQVSHFKLNNLLIGISNFRVDDAQKAYSKLAAGKIDFAVLWEPFTSQALTEIPGTKSLIDTSKVQGVIIDVAIVSRKLIASEPELVEKVARAYFSTAQHYLNSSQELVDLAAKDSGKDDVTARKMLSGVKFTLFGENCVEWFNVQKKGSQERLVDSIERICKILVNVGDLKTDPLQGNPYTIVNSKTLENILKRPGKLSLEGSVAPGAIVSSKIPSRFFNKLSTDEWKKVSKNIVGTLIDRPITFDSGQSEIPEEFQELLQEAAYKLAHYPTHRLVIEAHVSAGSDSKIDLELSEQRALSIKSFLIKECNVVEERILATGLGSSNPPNQLPDESLQAWKRRCRRAKIYLAQE